jgi:hypothetical protein
MICILVIGQGLFLLAECLSARVQCRKNCAAGWASVHRRRSLVALAEPCHVAHRSGSVRPTMSQPEAGILAVAGFILPGRQLRDSIFVLRVRSFRGSP